MNVFHRVAQRSMRANRMRTIVTIIGVILSAAMFTAVTTFATTLMTHLQRSRPIWTALTISACTM